MDARAAAEAGGHPSEATPAAPGNEAPGSAPTEAPVASDALERRAFVRRMGGDAVRTAGSVFSLSRILTRSAAAAGQAVMGELEALQTGTGVAEPTTVSTDAGAMARPVDTTIEAGQAPPTAATSEPTAATAPDPPPASRPPLLIDEDQRAMLEAGSAAVVAVNRDGHPPQLTTATILWDGDTLRFATVGWSRRTSMLRADSRIGLLVEGPGDGRFLTVTGRAQIIEGRAARVREAMWPVLVRGGGDGGEEAAEARWQDMLAADPDRAVIIVEPDQVLSGHR
jgi:nitroimidazol reductase NimA-like FMN-containing flavoprotein (pyridoxamine 5'-phosphate oxidase superfamily)